ncbi:DUF397 domain-containing protein [Streptomyces tateyamensis]|uniref:DUF397 domain-containing protein n=1 Tax=Streptomyces tateyamensis TaxID=565073 RepID=A0A2V4N7M8_9ACTN|nr:DUF397 domain-containing protein [Streptomyces tateyamensis]PYC66660.1 DUF397 domain-containing protein [Streptomyces tateyamensis]
MQRELSATTWRKSSFSGQGANCIEIAESFPSMVPVRDSKDPEGPVLTFPDQAFAAFVTAVKSGALHLR